MKFVFQAIHDLLHQVLPNHAEDHRLVGLQTQQLQKLGVGRPLAVGHHLKIYIVLPQYIQVKLALGPVHHGDQEL